MNENENYENKQELENVPEEMIPNPPAEESASPQTEEGSWQPYNPNQKYTNNWSAGKKQNSGKNAAVFVAVMASTVALVLLAFCGVLLAKVSGISGILDIFGTQPGNISEDASDTEASSTENINKDNPDLNINITDIPQISTEYTKLYEKCSVSCVSIISKPKNSTGYSLGSGFVLSADGYIATNHHVIEDGDKITVRFYNGTEYEAVLVGSDSITDLAVLKIDAKDLTPVALGDSDKLSVGESVVAIGTPYDISLAGTMTAGIVSGLKREVECTDDYGNVVKTMTLIQTDASINPGNSGGPLFNLAGQVIGINTLKLMDEYEGIGFSIPITDAAEVFEKLVKYGELPDYDDTEFVKTSPKLHITVMSVSDARNSAQYGRFIDKNAPEGVYVTEVTPGTAIYEAGLEMYDIITEFNGVVLEGREDLANELAKYKAGDEVTVKVYHRGQYKTLTFKLDKAA